MKKKTVKKFMWILLTIVAVIAVAAVCVLNHPAFGRTPRGERLEKVKLSKHYNGREFVNLHTTPAMTGDKSFIQSGWDYMFNKPKDTAPKDSVPTVKTDLKSLNPKENLVVWLGHSSLYIQQDGLRLLVDPVLTNEFPASFMLTPFKGTMVYSPDDMPNIDALIITHDHWDHLDYGTIKKLKNRIGKVICPLGVGEHFEYWGIPTEKIVELDWEDETSVNNDVNIKCLPSRHFSGRGLSRNKTLWAGYMIDGSRRVYISGDGGYDTHFKEIASEYPDIDLAIIENGQYSEDWKYIHLPPQDLQKAISDLNPTTVMTVHNSKYSLAPHSWKDPMENIFEYSIANNIPLTTPLIGQPILATDTTMIQSNWWKAIN